MIKNKNFILDIYNVSIISLAAALFVSINLYAKAATSKINNQIETFSARTVTLLPIISNLNEDAKQQIFESLQIYLKSHSYLKYRDNEGFYDIIKRKKGKMNGHLNNKAIIKTVSNQMRAGSIIRINIQQYSHGTDIKLEILSQNGDIQYELRETFVSNKISYVTKILDHWLSGFFGEDNNQVNITGIYENKIIIEYPKNADKLYSKQQFIVYKNSSKVAKLEKDEKYPIDNKKGKETEKSVKVAYGFISRLDHNFISGSITKIHAGESISIHDQVSFEEYDSDLAAKNPYYKYYKYDLSNYRDKGQLSLYKLSNELSADSSTASYSGIQLNTDIYLPSKKIISFEYSEHTSQASGESSNTSLSSNYKLLYGRTSIPKDTKYIRYFDYMAGLFVDNYSLSALGISGAEDQSIIGPIICFKMEHPISRGFTILTGLDLNTSLNIAESAELVIIDGEGPIGYNIELGMRYRFKDVPWSIKGIYQIKKNKIKIDDDDSDKILNIQSNNILVGFSNFF